MIADGATICRELIRTDRVSMLALAADDLGELLATAADHPAWRVDALMRLDRATATIDGRLASDPADILPAGVPLPPAAVLVRAARARLAECRALLNPPLG